MDESTEFHEAGIWSGGRNGFHLSEAIDVSLRQAPPNLFLDYKRMVAPVFEEEAEAA